MSLTSKFVVLLWWQCVRKSSARTVGLRLLARFKMTWAGKRY